MPTLRRILFLTLFISLLSFCLLSPNQKNSRAALSVDACQDQCQATYDGCISNADRDYDWCYDQAEINEWGCEDDAYYVYQDCLNTWGWWPAMAQNICENPFNAAMSQCWNNFNSAIQQCASTHANAESTCQGQLEDCMSHCP